MSSPTTKTKGTSTIKPNQKFEGHTNGVRAAILLPGEQQIITCSFDASLRVWNLRTGKQVGADWRDGESPVYSIALSPDGKKVVSGSVDGTVKLWDIDTGKVITKWTGHTDYVMWVCWSRDGWSVLSGSFDGTVRQWDVESGETILKPIVTGHQHVYAAVYSPDTTLIATAGWHAPSATEHGESPVKIWDAKTGKLVTTLKGHMHAVRCLAWTMDGKMLVSGSYDCSIRTWDTTKWEQIAVLDEHTDFVFTIAISPNGRILASPSRDRTVRLWNLDNGQPISSPLQHAEPVDYVSFSQDGKLLATGCRDKNAYTWNIAAIFREAGLDDLLSYPKANKSITHSNSTRRLVQRRPPAFRAPQGFFHGVPPGHSQFSAQSHTRSSEPQGSTPLHRLVHRRPSNAQDTSPSSPLKWARALLKWRGQSSEGTELQGRSTAVVEVPYAKGKRRNASAREVALAKQKQKMRALNSKNSTAASLQHHKPIVVKPSSQPQPAVSNSSIAPAVGDNTAATTPPPRPDVILRQAGLWTRFRLLICCLSPEYQDDGRH